MPRQPNCAGRSCTPLAEVSAPLLHLAAQDDHGTVLENIDGQARQEPLRTGPNDRLYNRWLDELRTLLNAASESRTKVDLDDAIAELLTHAPPRAPALLHTQSHRSRNSLRRMILAGPH